MVRSSAAASESVPLANLGFRNVRSLEPGTLVVANHKGIRTERYAPSPRQSHCFFEWIYFANVASTLDDRSVYLSRASLGKELARLEDVPLDADTIVVPVPDTAKAAADAMAFALGVPSVEGLMRNRYVGRTFIEGTADRAAKARLKYTPLPEVLAGKRVLLVEDSIVRSTTMRPWSTRSATEAGPRDPSPRRLPADHRSLLLRHRHVAQGRALRHPLYRRRGRRRLGGRAERAWPGSSAPTACATCPSTRSRGRSASRPIASAAPASRASIPTETGQYLYQIENDSCAASRLAGRRRAGLRACLARSRSQLIPDV